MDFITEFTKFIQKQPISPVLQEKIIKYVTELKRGETISKVSDETLADNTIKMFKEHPGLDDQFYKDYILYTLSKARE